MAVTRANNSNNKRRIRINSSTTMTYAARPEQHPTSSSAWSPVTNYYDTPRPTTNDKNNNNNNNDIHNNEMAKTMMPLNSSSTTTTMMTNNSNNNDKPRQQEHHENNTTRRRRERRAECRVEPQHRSQERLTETNSSLLSLLASWCVGGWNRPRELFSSWSSLSSSSRSSNLTSPRYNNHVRSLMFAVLCFMSFSVIGTHGEEDEGTPAPSPFIVVEDAVSNAPSSIPTPIGGMVGGAGQTDDDTLETGDNPACSICPSDAPFIGRPDYEFYNGAAGRQTSCEVAEQLGQNGVYDGSTCSLYEAIYSGTNTCNCVAEDPNAGNVPTAAPFTVDLSIPPTTVSPTQSPTDPIVYIQQTAVQEILISPIPAEMSAEQIDIFVAECNQFYAIQLRDNIEPYTIPNTIVAYNEQQYDNRVRTLRITITLTGDVPEIATTAEFIDEQGQNYIEQKSLEVATLENDEFLFLIQGSDNDDDLSYFTNVEDLNAIGLSINGVVPQDEATDEPTDSPTQAPTDSPVVADDQQPGDDVTDAPTGAPVVADGTDTTGTPTSSPVAAQGDEPTVTTDTASPTAAPQPEQDDDGDNAAVTTPEEGDDDDGLEAWIVVLVILLCIVAVVGLGMIIIFSMRGNNNTADGGAASSNYKSGAAGGGDDIESNPGGMSRNGIAGSSASGNQSKNSNKTPKTANTAAALGLSKSDEDEENGGKKEQGVELPVVNNDNDTGSEFNSVVRAGNNSVGITDSSGHTNSKHHATSAGSVMEDSEHGGDDSLSYAYSLEPGNIDQQSQAAHSTMGGGSIHGGGASSAGPGGGGSVGNPGSIGGGGGTGGGYGGDEISESLASRKPTMVTRQVVAPPGKLGIVIDTTIEGPFVHKVNANSPLEGLIFPGDIIIAIDDVDTKAMSASAITALMVKTAKQRRKLTVLSEDVQ